ncbi:hypothetical protein J4455_04380 [Candidatus Woesearchaeota archaeon]|nr:hypothetical protein [Candidatus Woesearchaeota archaeon]
MKKSVYTINFILNSIMSMIILFSTFVSESFSHAGALFNLISYFGSLLMAIVNLIFLIYYFFRRYELSSKIYAFIAFFAYLSILYLPYLTSIPIEGASFKAVGIIAQLHLLILIFGAIYFFNFSSKVRRILLIVLLSVIVFNISIPFINRIQKVDSCEEFVDASSRDQCYWEVNFMNGAYDPKICQKLTNESKERCFLMVGKERVDLSQCESISNQEIKDECILEVGIGLMRKGNSDIELCGKIQTQEFKEDCMRLLKQ